jgi:shikimate dehydrogenase
MKECTVIANCTPLGMKPHEDEKPDILYEWITKDHVLFDCIYNPEKTKFLEEGEKRGAQILNGYAMFMAQAKKAWEIFMVESK